MVTVLILHYDHQSLKNKKFKAKITESPLFHFKSWTPHEKNSDYTTACTGRRIEGIGTMLYKNN